MMRSFDIKIMQAVNELFEGHNDFIEKFFPDMSPGELAVELYNAGLIPDDLIEGLLND